MSEQKTEQQQIEEMAVLGCVRNPKAQTAEECSVCGFKDGSCDAYKHAERLYAADYRKQSETVIEFVERLKKRLKVFCSDDREYKFTFEGIAWNLDELAAEFGAEVEE